MSTTTDPAPATPNGAQVPAKLPPMDMMRTTLNRLEAEFKMALPPQIPVEKFIRTTMTAVQMNPDLLGADRRSLLAACMKAAQDGLLVDQREAALVIYGTKVQYMPMIGGVLKKIRNSGQIATISAHVAYENDEFRYELGDDERIVHRPNLNGDRGKAVAAYSIAKTKDGAVYREVMSVAQIEQVRNVSKAKNNGPWVAWWEEMAKKSVTRRLAKRLPSSADVDAVFDNDNDNYELERQVGVTSEQPTVATPNRLRASISIDDAVAEDPTAPKSEESQPQAKE